MTRTQEQLEQEQEVERNYQAFRKMEFPRSLSLKYVVLRDREVVKYADTSHEAELWGMRKYKDDRFSIQQIDAPDIYIGGMLYATS